MISFELYLVYFNKIKSSAFFDLGSLVEADLASPSALPDASNSN